MSVLLFRVMNLIDGSMYVKQHFIDTPCTHVVYDVDGCGWRNPLSGVHGGVNEYGGLPPPHVFTHL